jgi:hypothetical protein
VTVRRDTAAVEAGLVTAREPAPALTAVAAAPASAADAATPASAADAATPALTADAGAPTLVADAVRALTDDAAPASAGVAAAPVRAARAWPLLVIGGVCGLAWASGLRGFMVEIAGAESTFTWFGTFEGILLPGVVTGLLLGWAEHARRTGGRPGWRWTALAPLVFVLATPTVIVSVFTDGGIGGGAIALPLFGMAGGYAMSGRGPRAGRIAAGLAVVVTIVAVPVVASLISPDDSPTTPRGTWAALLLLSFITVLAFACAIPHRPTVPRD